MDTPVEDIPDESIPEVDDARIQKHFYLRRMHSLIGVLPLTIYLVLHLLIGSAAHSGKGAYDALQEAINRWPFLLPFEILIIVLPLLYHAVYGITIAVRSRNNQFMFPHRDNWRYALQRYTGYFLAIFFCVHLYFLWIQVRFTSDGRMAFDASAYDVVRELLQNSTFMVFYTLAVIAVAFHCANGLWNFCQTWGITTNDKSRRVAGWIAGVIFIVLLVLGNRAVQAFYGG